MWVFLQVYQCCECRDDSVDTDHSRGHPRSVCSWCWDWWPGCCTALDTGWDHHLIQCEYNQWRTRQYFPWRCCRLSYKLSWLEKVWWTTSMSSWFRLSGVLMTPLSLSLSSISSTWVSISSQAIVVSKLLQIPELSTNQTK